MVLRLLARPHPIFDKRFRLEIGSMEEPKGQVACFDRSFKPLWDTFSI